MTANVTPATSDAPDACELSADELDAVSGGWFTATLGGRLVRRDQGGQMDSAQMFQQILQQVTQGG